MSICCVIVDIPPTFSEHRSVNVGYCQLNRPSSDSRPTLLIFSVSVTAVDYNLDWPQTLLFLILIRSVPGTGGKDAMTCPVVENGW